MDRFARTVLPRLIDAAWRRRYLLIVPVLAMMPLSVVGALLMPGTFAARCLMLLQDTSAENPLFKENGYTYTPPQERVAGFRAILKSDAVLGESVDELGLAPSHDPKRRGLKIQELRGRISLDLIGDRVLEFRLVGDAAKGLGKQLDTVTSHFMEALAAQTGTTVGELLVAKKRQELEAAEAEHERLKERFSTAIPGGVDAALQRLNEMRQRFRDITQSAALTNAALEEVHTQLRTREQVSDPNRQLDEVAAKLLEFQDLDEARADLQTEIIQLQDSIRAIARSVDDYYALDRDLAASGKTLAAAKEAFDAYTTRFSNIVPGRGAPLVNTPERTVVIDLPKDPEFRTISRILIALLGITAGVVLGIGLSFIVEMMDTAIRSSDQVLAATGLPVIARLPRIEPDHEDFPAGLAYADGGSIRPGHPPTNRQQRTDRAAQPERGVGREELSPLRSGVDFERR